MGNCIDCQPKPLAINITKKVGVTDHQLTAIKVRDLPNYDRWVYIKHKIADGSDITLLTLKEEIAKICKCEPQQILCYYATDRDLELGQHGSITQDLNLPHILFNKDNVELHYIKMRTTQYEDGVYKAPPLGTAYPPELSVKDWSPAHVLWWLEITEANPWLANRFKGTGITGRQLLLTTELTLRDLGVTNPAERLALLDKIRQLH